MAKTPEKKNRQWIVERVPFARRNDNSRFYNARAWRKVSKSYRLQYPICECDECKELNRVLPAEVVDHTRGLQFLLDNGLDPYNFNELKSMNHLCHNKKSGRDAHKTRG